MLPDRFSNYPVNVRLDGSGNGTIRFQATGQNVAITNLYVAVATQTLQAKCTIYKGQIAATNAINTTNSGSTGASAHGRIELLDGEPLFVVWTGGDANTQAIATFSGVTLPFNVAPDPGTSFTWEDPIAAGDGSLIYPSIKSPNYVAGVSGWAINRDGSAEFSTGTFRGDVLITSPSGSNIHAFADANFAEIDMQPPNASGGGITFQPARIYTNSPGDQAQFLIEAPDKNNSGLVQEFTMVNDGITTISSLQANIINIGDSNTLNPNSFIGLTSAAVDITNTFRRNGVDQSKGIVDTEITSSSVGGFTTTDTAIMTATEVYQSMVNTRYYEVCFTGRILSTIVGDRVGFRIWAGAVGSTLLVDFGQVTIGTANVAQPFYFNTGFVGVPGATLTLSARRVGGTGTLTADSRYAKIVDLIAI